MYKNKNTLLSTIVARLAIQEALFKPPKLCYWKTRIFGAAKNVLGIPQTHYWHQKNTFGNQQNVFGATKNSFGNLKKKFWRPDKHFWPQKTLSVPWDLKSHFWRQKKKAPKKPLLLAWKTLLAHPVLQRPPRVSWLIWLPIPVALQFTSLLDRVLADAPGKVKRLRELQSLSTSWP